jgi:hypothetical protein
MLLIQRFGIPARAGTLGDELTQQFGPDTSPGSRQRVVQLRN